MVAAKYSDGLVSYFCDQLKLTGNNQCFRFYGGKLRILRSQIMNKLNHHLTMKYLKSNLTTNH